MYNFIFINVFIFIVYPLHIVRVPSHENRSEFKHIDNCDNITKNSNLPTILIVIY